MKYSGKMHKVNTMPKTTKNTRNTKLLHGTWSEMEIYYSL